MSVYFYLACDSCKVRMPFVNHHGGVLRPLSDDKDQFLDFLWKHLPHGLTVFNDLDLRFQTHESAYEPDEPASQAVRDVNRECDTFDRCVQSIAGDICPRCNGFKKVTVRSPRISREHPFFDRIVSVPCPDCAATGWRKP